MKQQLLPRNPNTGNPVPFISRQSVWLAGISLAIVLLTTAGLWLADVLLRFVARLGSIDGLVVSNLLSALSNPWIILGVVVITAVFAMCAVAQMLFWYAAVHLHDKVDSFWQLLTESYRLTRESLRRWRKAKLFMALYLLIILPLGGVAVVGSLGASFEIPEFVVSELLKFQGGKTLFLLFTLATIWLNLRLALSVPAFMRAQSSFPEAARLSWRIMKRPALVLTLPIALAPFVLRTLGEVATWAAVRLVGVVEGFSSGVALVLAGVLITAAEVIVFLIIFKVSLLITSLTLKAVDQEAGVSQSNALALNESAGAADNAAGATDYSAQDALGSAFMKRLVIAGGLAGALMLTTNTILVANTSIHTIKTIAHRGVPAHAVENSLEGLEVAADLGVDYVELDVLETRDQKLVVFHDLTLVRLAGSNQRIADLTYEELAAIPLSQGTHTARIPSFEEFLAQSRDRDQKLVVELKIHGNESANFIPNVVELLKKYDPEAEHLVQASYGSLLNEVRELAPSIQVGYIVPFAFGVSNVPDFDFYSIEQGVINRAVARRLPSDAELYVWTVNDSRTVRRLMTDTRVDGIITSEPERALAAQVPEAEQELVSKRLDILLRSTVVP